MTVRVIVTLVMVPMAPSRLICQVIGNILHHLHRILMAIKIIVLLVVLVLFVGDDGWNNNNNLDKDEDAVDDTNEDAIADDDDDGVMDIEIIGIMIPKKIYM